MICVNIAPPCADVKHPIKIHLKTSITKFELIKDKEPPFEVEDFHKTITY